MTGLLRLSILALLALAVFLTAADRLWLADLAQHFRAQWTLLAIGCLAAALLQGRRREALAALLVGVLLGSPVLGMTIADDWGRLSGFPIAGATAAHPARPDAPAAAPARLTLVSANVYYKNRTPDEMVDALLATDADVLVLAEVIPSWKAVTQRLRARYPYRTPDRWWAGTSTVIWSRYPLHLDPAELRWLANGSVLDVTLDVQGRSLHLFGLHAPRPSTPKVLETRNGIFASLGQWTRARPMPTVMAGDFNAAPWTPALRRLIDEDGLERARPSRGWYASWPSPLGDLGIPIDHVLHTPSVKVESLQVVEIPGSDHRGLKAALAIP
ncbi:Uncharacterized conserved protein YafD, endonuclease/exonuclease/phosphatase (EEP) superfamily [Tistlia consotensis]|uniref:Uncharacterized conserved protein YafD, endonuclease/exonuclease/phosphatase (EEP) superfamily n=1 Tax=Tistlia consotensis USBA 355 TaxID=560819 RepID=A0A1Y6C9U0_9PROT|nr:endonuclease/exonuclease/phosphatase family protein [Tistlia consotensis]SMF44499.1 Uncharacterized conserved protein YafD, endonuclease/exonuclease/phosphatase (EEP) superfamily [Tistlia consotensis USBA 355]SNR43296.1 Uncharacterized conserved protein YafD, endonuclease/exonuclease/phosphatase (EEP) superfamily [Tistlia consotensis]